MPYIPNSHKKYNLLPICILNDVEMIITDISLRNKIEKIVNKTKGMRLHPYCRFKTYQDYFNELEDIDYLVMNSNLVDEKEFTGLLDMVINKEQIDDGYVGFYDTKTHKCHNAINGLKLFFSLDFLQACYIIKSFFDNSI